jgi:hypothetical protein
MKHPNKHLNILRKLSTIQLTLLCVTSHVFVMEIFQNVFRHRLKCFERFLEFSGSRLQSYFSKLPKTISGTPNILFGCHLSWYLYLNLYLTLKGEWNPQWNCLHIPQYSHAPPCLVSEANSWHMLIQVRTMCVQRMKSNSNARRIKRCTEFN